MDSIHLIGAEDVVRASNRMSSAAETMSQAASSIDHTLTMFLRQYEELISREMRVHQVVQEEDGVTYTLPITDAHSTPNGVVIVVGSKSG